MNEIAMILDKQCQILFVHPTKYLQIFRLTIVVKASYTMASSPVPPIPLSPPHPHPSLLVARLHQYGTLALDRSLGRLSG